MVTKQTRAKPSQPSLGNWIGGTGQQANISELARAAGLDRATVVKRLEAAGVQPRRTRAKEKTFDLGAATAALTRPAVDHTGYHKARTQKTTAEAARLLLKLQRERGELAPVAELRELAYQFIKAMHQRFNRYAREGRGRLFKAKNRLELERILAADFALIFDELKRDFPKLF